jgi:hypothetical protein
MHFENTGRNLSPIRDQNRREATVERFDILSLSPTRRQDRQGTGDVSREQSSVRIPGGISQNGVLNRRVKSGEKNAHTHGAMTADGHQLTTKKSLKALLKSSV